MRGGKRPPVGRKRPPSRLAIEQRAHVERGCCESLRSLELGGERRGLSQELQKHLGVGVGGEGLGGGERGVG